MTNKSPENFGSAAGGTAERLAALDGTETVDDPAYERALASLQPELERIPSQALVAINVDVAHAAGMVLGAMPALRRLQPEMARQFGAEMAAAVDRLPLAAHALGQAHAQHQAVEALDDLEPYLAPLLETRSVLGATLEAAVARKLIAAAALGRMRGGRSAQNVAFDVLRLVSLFRDHWAAIEGRLGTTQAELDQAEAAAHRLLVAAAVRAQPGMRASALLRQRAFTHLYETYDDVRRMVSFLRWKHGDESDWAPTWYRGGRQR